MKKYLIVLLSLFLVGTVVAGGVIVSNIDKGVSLESAQSTALSSINLDTYEVTDYNYTSRDQMERCLYKDGAINTCQRFQTYYTNCTSENETTLECLEETDYYYSAEELTAIMDSWEERRLEGIADATISRQADNTKEKVGEGTTTVSAK